VGQRLTVSPEKMMEYIAAAHTFSLELLKAVLASPHVRYRPKPTG
jgi:hypothetical protein